MRVLLYFDWIEYGHIVERLGAQLTWSSRKAGKTQLSQPYPRRVMTVGGRVPRISIAGGRFLNGQSKTYRVLFDGVLPSVIAAQYAEMLRANEGEPPEE